MDKYSNRIKIFTRLREPRKFGDQGELLIYGGGNVPCDEQIIIDRKAQEIIAKAYEQTTMRKFISFVSEMAAEEARRKAAEKRAGRKLYCVVS
jgi:hypothetical protein